MNPQRFKHYGFYILTAVLLLNACTRQVVLVGTQNQQYAFSSGHPVDRELDLFIEPYRDSLEKIVDKALAASETELTVGRSGKELYPSQVAMGNFMADAILAIAKQKAAELKKPIPEVSIFTWGGIRKSLPKGEITLRNVFELMPFENEMVVLKLSGQQINSLLKQISKNYNPIGGASMNQDDVQSIRVNGRLVQNDQFYHVVVSDYHASGGDNMTVLLEAEDSYFSGIKIRDAIVLYLQQLTQVNQMVKPDYEPRIKN